MDRKTKKNKKQGGFIEQMERNMEEIEDKNYKILGAYVDMEIEFARITKDIAKPSSKKKEIVRK